MKSGGECNSRADPYGIYQAQFFGIGVTEPFAGGLDFWLAGGHVLGCLEHLAGSGQEMG